MPSKFLDFHKTTLARVPGLLYTNAERADRMAYFFGLLSAAILFFLPELARISPPRWWALPILGLMILHAVSRAYYLRFAEAEAALEEKSQEATELRKRLEPEVEIVYDPKRFPACIMDNIWDDADGVHVIDRLVRVGIQNLGGTSVFDVGVQLESIEPQTTHFLPARLAWMHEVYRGMVDPNQGTTLNPGTAPTLYASVARKRSAGNASEFIVLQYAGAHLPPDQLMPGRYNLTLIVSGRDMPAVRGHFVLSVGADGVLHLDWSAPRVSS